MDRPIGVGIVGLSANGGWAAAGHLPALAAVEGMKVCALAVVIDGTAGRLEVTGAEFPHIGPVTVRSAKGRGRLAELKMPGEYDLYPHLARTHIHNLAHAYTSIRDDLLNGTSVTPDFLHAVNDIVSSMQSVGLPLRDAE